VSFFFFGMEAHLDQYIANAESSVKISLLRWRVAA